MANGNPVLSGTLNFLRGHWPGIAIAIVLALFSAGATYGVMTSTISSQGLSAVRNRQEISQIEQRLDDQQRQLDQQAQMHALFDQLQLNIKQEFSGFRDNQNRIFNQLNRLNDRIDQLVQRK